MFQCEILNDTPVIKWPSQNSKMPEDKYKPVTKII